MKMCTRCRVEKPLDEFHKDSKRLDGRQSTCKQCKSQSAPTHRLYGGPVGRLHLPPSPSGRYTE